MLGRASFLLSIMLIAAYVTLAVPAKPDQFQQGDHQRDVWDFNTTEFIVIDDFEHYDSADNCIYYAWRDGLGYYEPDTLHYYTGNSTGAVVGNNCIASYTEEGTVHSGNQSMLYSYDNDSKRSNSKYSEIALTLSSEQDWTKDGVRVLSLWFYGDPCNVAEQMYVALNDGVHPVTVMPYNGDANNVKKTKWQEWNINLDSFAVNFNNVNQVLIGFGTRGNKTIPGGSGKVYFDDIRLYPSRCDTSHSKQQGDINGDCRVDYFDLEILANDWLASDYIIAVSAAAPSTDNLLAYYALNGDVLDNSDNGLHGTEHGNPTYASGMFGQAIILDGDGDYVSCPNNTAFDQITNKITITVWIRINNFNRNYQSIIAKGDNSWRISRHSNTNNIHWRCNGPSPDLRINGQANVNDGQWHHVAGTYDGAVARLYVDGIEDGSVETTGQIAKNTYHVYIGANQHLPGHEWNGLIDDVRIYSRVLSEAEIGYLADTTPGDGELYIPLKSPAELYNDEPPMSRSINFKDFVEMQSHWLEELVFPCN